MVRQLNELIPSELDKSSSSSSLVSASPNTSTGSIKEISESVHKPTLKRSNSSGTRTMLIQLDFVKSILTINPCMVSILDKFVLLKHNSERIIFQSYNSYLLLQGDDKLYINHGDVLQNIYHNTNAYCNDSNGNAYSKNLPYTGLSKEGQCVETSLFLNVNKTRCFFVQI